MMMIVGYDDLERGNPIFIFRKKFFRNPFSRAGAIM